MSADMNKPVNSDLYTEILQTIRDNFDAVIKMSHGSTGNIPVGAKQWSDTNDQFEEWDGSSWVALLQLATTTAAGLVQLSNSTNSTAQNRAATSKALKDAVDTLLKLDGSIAMAGNLDMGGNSVNNADVYRAGAGQEFRAGIWGGKGQIFCSTGGLDIGSDASGQNVNIYAKTAGGVNRVVMQIKADGTIDCYGNVTFNKGTITP